jgi:hypothetical protein
MLFLLEIVQHIFFFLFLFVSLTVAFFRALAETRN